MLLLEELHIRSLKVKMALQRLAASLRYDHKFICHPGSEPAHGNSAAWLSSKPQEGNLTSDSLKSRFSLICCCFSACKSPKQTIFTCLDLKLKSIKYILGFWLADRWRRFGWVWESYEKVQREKRSWGNLRKKSFLNISNCCTQVEFKEWWWDGGKS